MFAKPPRVDCSFFPGISSGVIRGAERGRGCERCTAGVGGARCEVACNTSGTHQVAGHGVVTQKQVVLLFLVDLPHG